MKKIGLIIITIFLTIQGCSKPNAAAPIAIDYLTASGVPAPFGIVKVSVFLQDGINTGLTYTWTVSKGWAILNGGDTQTATILAGVAYSASGTATVTVSYTDHPDLFTTGTISLNTQGPSGPITLEYNAPWPKLRDNMRNTGLSTVNTSADTGSLKWTFTTNSFEDSPAIGADGVIYVSYAEFCDSCNYFYIPAFFLLAIDPYGFPIWTYQLMYGVEDSPTIGADGTIYVGSNDNNLDAINPNGSLKWKYTTGGAVYSSPAIGADGTIYVGSSDYNLYAINPNGSLKWKYTTGAWVYSSPAIGADGTIYIWSGDGNLYAIH